VILFLNSPFRDICQSDYTSRTAVSLHSQWHRLDAERFCLLESHVISIVGIAVSVNKTTTWTSHREVSQQSSSSQVHTVHLGSFIRVPPCNDISSLQIFLIVLFLEHSRCSLDVRQFSLFDDVRVDQIPHIVGSLLRLSCGSTSQYDYVIVDEVDFISYSIDCVRSSCGRSWVNIVLLESAQAMTPPSYLTAMMVVPMVSLG